MTTRILLVEDDERLAELTAEYLTKNDLVVSIEPRGDVAETRILAEQPDLDPFEFVRMIAAARITMPESYVRLSAGRQELGDGFQALCFMAGANSIFYGDKLLTTGNPEADHDAELLAKLDLYPEGQAPEPRPDLHHHHHD